MPEDESPITCRISSWFGRRMGILMLLLSATAIYFLYDGVIGYPKQNFNAALFAAFQSGKPGATDDFPKAEMFALAEFSEKQKTALESAVEAAKSGGTWSKFAATRHLSAAEPEKKSLGEMNEQKVYAAVLVAGAFLVFVFWQWQRRKTLSCDGSGIQFPNGKQVGFQDVTSLDLTKWDRGIAIVKTDSGTLATIDDYKYDGAGKIVERLRSKCDKLEIVSTP